jgi:hypothetical protein
MAIPTARTDARSDRRRNDNPISLPSASAGGSFSSGRRGADCRRHRSAAPAHQFLFSQFDASVGQYRRYNTARLTALSSPGCRLRACFMLDSLCASLANRFLLAAAMHSTRQIAFREKVSVPVSRLLDNVAARKFSKTIIAVWVPL